MSLLHTVNYVPWTTVHSKNNMTQVNTLLPTRFGKLLTPHIGLSWSHIFLIFLSNCFSKTSV